MSTITLTLPPDLARTLDALLEDERNHYAIAALRAGIEVLTEEGEEDEPLTQEELTALVGPPTAEDLAAIGRGFADADAGRFVEPEIAFAELRRLVGLPPLLPSGKKD